VKKQVVCAVGALALAASVIIGGTLLAQGGAQGAPPAAPAAPPAPTVKIAFINLAYVLKNYHKVDALALAFKKSYEAYEVDAKQKKAQMDAMEAENNDAKTASAKKEENLQKMTQLKREIEDINVKARKALAPQSEANTVGVYLDIQNAATKYAMANGFEMVLQFQDGFTKEDYNSPMNVMNKMQTRACIPMFYQQGNDISLQVVNSLNEAYAKSNPASAAAPAATGAAPSGH
jgi:Skp family chaperone for outer membrane proteins